MMIRCFTCFGDGQVTKRPCVVLDAGGLFRDVKYAMEECKTCNGTGWADVDRKTYQAIQEIENKKAKTYY